VGLLVGALWWGAGRIGTGLWGPAVGAALALAADLLVTGGLHLDAVADEADGLACRLPPEEAVAVMREGTIGAIGASAAAVVVLVRFALLSAVLAGAPGGHAGALIAVPAAGRFAMVWTMARTRGRRDHRAHRVGGDVPPSLASEIREATRGLPLAVSGAVALVSASVLAGPRGVAGIACACLVGSANAGFAVRRFGDVTGDVVGAGGLLGETAMLAAVTAHL
jgi:adenosylcobinamide-GDP ribazoletransferase